MLEDDENEYDNYYPQPKPPSTPSSPSTSSSPSSLLRLQRSLNLPREAASATALERANVTPQITIHTHTITPRYPEIPPPSHEPYTLRARIYTPRSHGYTPTHLPVYLYFHGGGFFNGSLDSEDAMCARLVSSLSARGRPIILVSADYRKTPQVRYPDPFEDAWEVFEWMERRMAWWNGDPNRVVVGGEDAGAGLAAWVAFFARTNVAGRRELDTRGGRLVRVVGVVLCNPWMPFLDRVVEEARGRGQGESPGHFERKKEREREMFTHDFYRALLDIHHVEPGHHALGPWTALGAMPPTYVLTFAESCLRLRQLMFAIMLMREGVDVHLNVLADSPHEIPDQELLPSSRPWGDELLEALLWCLRPME
ncbi:alpha/beta hydrolase [Aspergillus saccharolyticus JOP 1030-1]|uniref:Alpha/beta-hydrolase n=1 Tax=Aspergillus saccharolyticus JOP 1030-1 TaxID=1450539 RepID=A0A318ZMA9_9EURO|nr:alpha/beta-hydrolase [Aspergillus saccharolyticus JOP 1030-1]PYH41328.1 alpha/beta-hydrolase [Aspergillus saccharolyticus JOP 1030-1]